jgi:DNA polymerase-3 subunit beta
MNIRIKKKLLLEALQMVVNISSKNTSAPIINYVLLKTKENGFLNIKATNYDTAFSGNFEADISEPGEICLSSFKLFNLVREFQSEDIFFKSTPQNWVFINSGKSKIKLPGVASGLFPEVKFKDLKNKISLAGSIFKKVIDRTSFSIGDNDARKSLTGLNIKITSENQIRWVSADGYRMSQVLTKTEIPPGVEGNIIVPKKSLIEIKKVLDYRDNNVEISFDNNTFQLFSDKIKFKTQLIEKDYPNLEKLLENKNTKNIKVSKKELINSVRILSHISDDDDQISLLKLTVKEGLIVIESQKLELGEGNDEIQCDYFDEPFSMGMNTRFLMEALQIFESTANDKIIFNVTGVLAPLVIQSDDWEDFKTVLMPAKIKW